MPPLPPEGQTPQEPRSRVRFGEPPVRPLRIEPAPAQPPRPPALPASLQDAEEERRVLLRAREERERRSILRGLILLAVLVLCVALARAKLHDVFFPGWWHRW